MLNIIDIAKINREISELIRFNKKGISRFIKQNCPNINNIDCDALNKGIFIPLNDFIGSGGKRWRVSLFNTVIEILGYRNKESSKYSLIPELIHNGTLIADDIEDGSCMRRGRPSLHLIYGTDIAINLSQFLYFFPLAILIDIKDQRLVSRLSKIYIEEMINVSIGQAIDIVWHGGSFDIKRISYKNYLGMCSLKTGSLARMSVRMACAVAGVKSDRERVLSSFASSLGVAFQIKDDILDLTPSMLSKKKGGVGNDIREGKITLMVLRALRMATERDRRRLHKILIKHTDKRTEVSEAIDIINKYNGIEFSRDMANRIVEKGIEDLKDRFSTKQIDRLKDFTEFCLGRDV